MAFPTLWPKQGMKVLGFLSKRSKTRNATKARKVMKVSKAKKLSKLTLPKAAKVRKVKTVMKKMLKRKSKKTFRVVNFLDLGLGLKIGHCYTESHLQQLCNGDLSKLNRLANFMKDATKLRPDDNTSDAEQIRHGKKTNKVMRKVMRKVTIGKHTSKKRKALGKTASRLIQKSLSISEQRKTIAKIRIGQKKTKNGGHTPKLSELNSAYHKMKPLDKEKNVGRSKEKLTSLTLPALEKLYKKHKKNSLGTQPVNDTLAQTKEELISKPLLVLKDMCSKRSLTVSGTKSVIVKRLLGQEKHKLKDKMVRAILWFDGIARSKAHKQMDKERADARRQKEKVYNAAVKLKKDVSTKTNDELKDFLRSYGLKTSGTKKENVERVVALQRKQGEIERILSDRAARARKQELLSMSTASLMLECSKSKDVLEDNLLKQTMLDRLLLNETKNAASKVLDRLLVGETRK